MSKHAAELTRKDLKAPDAFQVAAVKAATWVSGKQKALVGAVVAALVAVAIVIGGMSWWDSRKGAAGGLLYRTLDDADGQISSVPLPGVTVPIFPTAHAFRAGSRIRITITAPGGDRPIWDFDTVDSGSTFNTIALGGIRSSKLVLPVIAGDTAKGTPLPPAGALRGQPGRTFAPASNGG